MDRAPSARVRSVDADLTVLHDRTFSMDVCTKSNRDRRPERPSCWDASRAVATLERHIVHPSPSASAPSRCVSEGCSPIRACACACTHCRISDLSEKRHSALRLIVLIFHLARHMHDYPQTPAPSIGDPMISFAEQRSLSEKLRFSRAEADVARQSSRDRCLTPLIYVRPSGKRT